jgi:hypothetical protein
MNAFLVAEQTPRDKSPDKAGEKCHVETVARASLLIVDLDTRSGTGGPTCCVTHICLH